MRCCTRLAKRLISILLLVWLGMVSAHAQGIGIEKAELRIGDDGPRLTASYNVEFPFVVQQALSRGIPLYFVSEFVLVRPRWYWMDEEIFRSEQVSKLSYNVLTRQYRIARGSLFQNFATLDDAIAVLGRQSSPALPLTMPLKDGGYIAASRLRLDITQLPRLLQVNALTGKDWVLNSDWYRWVLRPVSDDGQGG